MVADNAVGHHFPRVTADPILRVSRAFTTMGFSIVLAAQFGLKLRFCPAKIVQQPRDFPPASGSKAGGSTPAVIADGQKVIAQQLPFESGNVFC